MAAAAQAWRMVASLALLLALVAQARGADTTWRETPLDVTTLPYSDGHDHITVEWGSQGESIPRDPQEVRAQYDQLQAFLRSDALTAWRHRQQQQAEITEHLQGKRLVADWTHAFTAVPQQPATPETHAISTRALPLPEWVSSLAWDVRQILVIGAYDARSPAQIAWAEQVRAAHPQAQLYAVGWDSLRDYDRMLHAHPVIQSAVVTSSSAHTVDQWLADFGIQALPAVVTFPDPTHLLVTQGVRP